MLNSICAVFRLLNSASPKRQFIFPLTILCIVDRKEPLLTFLTPQILSPEYNYSILFPSILASASLAGVSSSLTLPIGCSACLLHFYSPIRDPYRQQIIFQLQRGAWRPSRHRSHAPSGLSGSETGNTTLLCSVSLDSTLLH